MYSYMRSTITDFSNRLLHLCYELERAEKIETVITYAMQYIDKPYIFNADDPFYGADCSGYLGYIFRAFGVIGQSDDYNCREYYGKFPHIEHPKAGAVVYYGPTAPQHAMLCMNDLWCIGATGGGPNCTSQQIAELTKARVRIKPIDYRKDIIGYNDPFHKLFE